VSAPRDFVTTERTTMKAGGVDPDLEGLEPLKYVRGVRVCFDPLECCILSFKTVVG